MTGARIIAIHSFRRAASIDARLVGTIGAIALLGSVALAGSGCAARAGDGARPHASQADDAPADSKRSEAPKPEGPSQRADAPAEAPGATPSGASPSVTGRNVPPQPPTEPDAAPGPDPYAIPYLRILELRSPTERPRIDARVAGRRELLLDTTNVQRMRLTREGLSIPRNLAVVLRLDGQNIEWTSSHTAIELERDRNGFWNVTRREPER